MRSQSKEALNPSRTVIYGPHSRPIVFEKDASGREVAYEQLFDPSLAKPVTKYDPDNPPLVAERQIPVETARAWLGFKKEVPLNEPIPLRASLASELGTIPRLSLAEKTG